MENFLRVLTGTYSSYKGMLSFEYFIIGRLDHSVPRSKRLLSDDRSNILVYMTGKLCVVEVSILYDTKFWQDEINLYNKEFGG